MFIYIVFCILCMVILTVEVRTFNKGLLRRVEILFIFLASIIPIVNIGAAIVALANLYDYVERTNGK